MPPQQNPVLRPGDAYDAVSAFLARHAPRDRSVLALPPSLGDRPPIGRGRSDSAPILAPTPPIHARSAPDHSRNRRRRLGELLGGELLGASSIASAVASGGGGGGGGGTINAGVHGDHHLGLSVVESIQDQFANALIEPFWSQWRGSFGESGGLLTTDSYASSTPRSCIMATHAMLVDGECAAVVRQAKQNALWARCSRDAGDGSPIGYMLLVNNMIWTLMALAPAATTIAASFGTAAGVGDTIALRVDGTAITGKLNGVSKVSATNATYSAAGYWGVGQWTNSAGANSYSSWSVAPV